MFCLGLVHVAWAWTCDHDSFAKGVNITRVPVQTSRWKLLSGRESMRLFFDYTYIDNPGKLGTGNYCAIADDSVAGVQCQAGDVMDDKKKTVIKETFENVKNYVQGLLKVDQVTGSFTLSDARGPVSQSRTDGKTDLYVTLYPKPYGTGSSTLASAMPVSIDQTTSRPIQGLTNVNLAAMPAQSSDFSTTGDRQFFEVAFHELCHVLGIGGGLFEWWINPETGSSWGKDNVPMCNYTKYGKTFKFLHTPKLHKLMVDRWGVEKFHECPAGVEIEDNGETGTAGSHWKLRTFMTEIMVGTTLGYSRISDVTLTALEDTGWYDVDHSRAEMLEWGDYRSIRGKTRDQFQNFAFEPPAKSWPDNYLIKTADAMAGAEQWYYDQGCTFDHRAVGVVQAYKRTCTNPPTPQCQYHTFYDANELGYYGDELFDYLLVYQPASNAMCFQQDTGNASRRSMCARVNGIGACQQMSCEGESLYVHIGDSSYQCSQANEQIQIDRVGTLICPDPNVVCGIFDSSTGGGSGQKEPGKGLGPGATAAIVIVVLAVVGVGVTLLVLFLMGKIFRKKAEGKDDLQV